MQENEFHKKSNKQKSKTIASIMKGVAKQKSRDERKRLKEKQKLRDNVIPKRKRARRDWAEVDEDDEEGFGFERMAPSHSVMPVLKQPADDEPAAADDGEQANEVDGSTAVVVGVARGRVKLDADGELLDADLAAPILSTQQTSVAVGDLALFERRDNGLPRVVAILPRRSVLSRPDPSNDRRERVIAANVDYCVIVLSMRSPGFKPGLVDRVLVALGRGGVKPILCINKIDLVDAGDRPAVEGELAPFRGIDVPVHLVSAETGEGIEGLQEELLGSTCVLVGQSGVGKSSILNAVDPDGERVVGAVRELDGKGRHTTTSSSLRRLAGGTAVIDTPGVRQFGLGKPSEDELLAAFPEIAGRAEGCRFNDCSHLVEPDCAVRAAVEAGEVPQRRFDSYARLRGED